MEDKSESVNQSLSPFSPDGNRLAKDQGVMFARAVTKMALAKNIKLAEGSLGVWEECAMEDIRGGRYDLEDFIAATKKIIRLPLFNRIDFADIYSEAMELAKTRRLREPSNLKLTEGRGSPMPAELREKIGSIGARI